MAASSSSQPTWLPYEPAKDCSQGVCSIYCPQWCYFIYPPPPPIIVSGDNSGPAFSPLVLVIIGVLASAFLLVSYYTIVSKYCGSFNSFHARLFGTSGGGGRSSRRSRSGGGTHGGAGQQPRPLESWSMPPSDGLDQSLINKIMVCRYKRGEGFVANSTDCSVCLGEFCDGESLRLLPKCRHAFHVQCIDTWLKSHSSCPLCRSNIAPASITELDGGMTHEVVVVIEDLGPVCEDGAGAASDGDAGEQKDQEEVQSSSLGGDGRMSIADVLQVSMEAELLAARESAMRAGAGSGV